MIFVTVGTHEQPFDRLVAHIDRLKAQGQITEEVIIQTGFSTYQPQHCTAFKLIPHKELTEYVRTARIVITHGGPASFIMPLQLGKIPVVVPRRKQYGEHVNDHQADFSHAVAIRQKNILVVDQVEDLADILNRYEQITQTMTADVASNNASFNAHLEQIARELLGEKA